ncbi:MAG: cytidylate kinase-like family protein [Deltaproteobacteria bacterium]|jgi:cytidylate kinase|nr:cytidylate kinase-like family protein [Deltaproteobacteria bacterium]MBW2470075.1 cytidylate kinase-like family protein [Deltaproteobacteria bacterium]MBW2487503.1 cytidylate kinase-like family protein [Deltaproteobacteria bacterium]MBW2518366.1 cytidylate kinase-like family protein [Deltaproteobacteria bacterium]
MAVITISRQYGAGGKTLGRMIAAELGYEFADSEIIAKVAEMANVSTHWVETVEKEAGGKLSRFVSRMVSKPLVDKILKGERGYIDETIYLDYLVLIIAQIADEGDVVILGRGSQYILDDHPEAFHILMINSFENRVRFMQKNYDLSEKRATRIIRGEDKRRKTLYQKLGKTDYDNPFLYHLVLNMSRLSLQEAKQIVCHRINLQKE